jgi:hypothetical protein
MTTSYTRIAVTSARASFLGPRVVASASIAVSVRFDDGLHRGERVRQSLRTRSAQVADRRLAELRKKLDSKSCELVAALGKESPQRQEQTLADALHRFLLGHGSIDTEHRFQGDLAFSTYRKYRCGLRLLRAFCELHGVRQLANVTMEVLEDYRRSRKILLVTWKVELQTLRTFFGYCVRHSWAKSNPATELKPPPKPQAERSSPLHLPGGEPYPRRM